jgi:hypothetical protein
MIRYKCLNIGVKMKFPQVLLLILLLPTLAISETSKSKSHLSPKLKKIVEKEFIQFHEENQKLREKHQNALYEDQKVILETNHKKTVAFFREISKLQQTISLGEKNENRKVQAEIERKKKIFKGKLQEDRRKARKKMTDKRDKFQKMMDKRRESFKDKMKAHKKQIK